MGKELFFGVCVILFISCRQNNRVKKVSEYITFEISTEKWPKKSNIDPKAMLILKDWPEYNEMETSFDDLYGIENREDLKLIIEDLIEKQKLLESSDYPEIFDKPQIKSRQKVFKTYFLKVKGDLEYRLDPKEPVLEMINAYNALRNQFNVVINNTLDTKLILGE